MGEECKRVLTRLKVVHQHIVFWRKEIEEKIKQK